MRRHTMALLRFILRFGKLAIFKNESNAKHSRRAHTLFNLPVGLPAAGAQTYGRLLPVHLDWSSSAFNSATISGCLK
jgi:hypothetical protein